MDINGIEFVSNTLAFSFRYLFQSSYQIENRHNRNEVQEIVIDMAENVSDMMADLYGKQFDTEQFIDAILPDTFEIMEAENE